MILLSISSTNTGLSGLLPRETHPTKQGISRDQRIVTMSKAYLKAKEKYDAMINDTARKDFTCKLLTPQALVDGTAFTFLTGRTNRIATTRHPSTGGCEVVTGVDHEKSRRASSGSIKDRIKDMMNRPAY